MAFLPESDSWRYRFSAGGVKSDCVPVFSSGSRPRGRAGPRPGLLHQVLLAEHVDAGDGVVRAAIGRDLGPRAGGGELARGGCSTARADGAWALIADAPLHGPTRSRSFRQDGNQQQYHDGNKKPNCRQPEQRIGKFTPPFTRKHVKSQDAWHKLNDKKKNPEGQYDHTRPCSVIYDRGPPQQRASAEGHDGEDQQYPITSPAPIRPFRRRICYDSVDCHRVLSVRVKEINNRPS